MNECNPNKQPDLYSSFENHNILKGETKKENFTTQMSDEISTIKTLTENNTNIIEENQKKEEEINKELSISNNTTGNEVATIYQNALIIFSNIYQETGSSL